MSTELSLIIARRKEIDGERETLAAALRALDTETAELDLTERVLTRLMSRSTTVDKTAIVSQGVMIPGASTTTGGKPPGTPTMPEMILAVVKDFDKIGASPVHSNNLVAEIHKRWWPGVTATEVGPIAWRMAKRGQIVKSGNVYSLPLAKPEERFDEEAFIAEERRELEYDENE